MKSKMLFCAQKLKKMHSTTFGDLDLIVWQGVQKILILAQKYIFEKWHVVTFVDFDFILTFDDLHWNLKNIIKRLINGIW